VHEVLLGEPRSFVDRIVCLVSDPLLLEQVFVKHASRMRKWDTDKQFDMILGDYTGTIVGPTERMLDAWPETA
jgi:hypothetical protein